jgi:hypothetical protein
VLLDNIVMLVDNFAMLVDNFGMLIGFILPAILNDSALKSEFKGDNNDDIAVGGTPDEDSNEESVGGGKPDGVNADE